MRVSQSPRREPLCTSKEQKRLQRAYRVLGLSEKGMPQRAICAEMQTSAKFIRSVLRDEGLIASWRAENRERLDDESLRAAETVSATVFECMSISETARRHGMSRQKVYKHLARALGPGVGVRDLAAAQESLARFSAMGALVDAIPVMEAHIQDPAVNPRDKAAILDVLRKVAAPDAASVVVNNSVSAVSNSVTPAPPAMAPDVSHAVARLILEGLELGDGGEEG